MVPSDGREREGLVKLIEDGANAAQNWYLMKYYCTVHWENLGTKALKMDNVMQIISKTVNSIRAKGIESSSIPGIPQKYWCWLWCHHLLFRRWVSQGQMLKRFYDLWRVIKSFMVSKKQICAGTWQWKLAYRFSIFSGFNCLFKWVKHASSRWQPTYQYHVSNRNSVPNETEMMAILN